MRLIVIKQPTDIQKLSTQLLKTPTGDAGKTALDRVKALNPHLDLQNIKAGTVILVPNEPSFKAADTQSVGGDTFNDLTNDIAAGMRNAAQGARAGLAQLVADRTAVVAALTTDVVKRLVDGDPLLKQQLADAEKQSATDQKQAQDAVNALETAQKDAQTELQALGKLLG